jgi:hypothetical protein
MSHALLIAFWLTVTTAASIGRHRSRQEERPMLTRQTCIIACAVTLVGSAWSIDAIAQSREAPHVITQTGTTQVIKPEKIEGNKVPDSVRQLLSKSGQLELFSLDPDPFQRGPTGFHQYRILGSTTLSGDAANRLVAALEEGASEPMFGPAHCFRPRHGVRVTAGPSRVDLVICFECNGARVYVEGDVKDAAAESYYLPGHSPQGSLNKVLADAGVPLPTR